MGWGDRKLISFIFNPVIRCAQLKLEAINRKLMASIV